MSRLAAFCWGVAIASALAGLLLVKGQSARHDDEAELWRVRAIEAERQLAAARNHVSARPEYTTTPLESASEPAAVTAPSTQGWNPPPAQSAALPPAPDPAWLATAHQGQQEEWNALVAGALQAEVQRRLSHALPPEQQQRLVDTLARLRDASLGLSQEPLDPEDPLSLSDQLTRTIVLLEADRTFRHELGIGVSDFLQGLNGGQIEEVVPVEPAVEASE